MSARAAGLVGACAVQANARRPRLGTNAVRTGTRLESFKQTPATVRAQVFDRAAAAAQEIEADAHTITKHPARRTTAATTRPRTDPA